MKLKRPPAVKAILKQILMFGFYFLLLTYEVDSIMNKFIDQLFLYDTWFKVGGLNE